MDDIVRKALAKWPNVPHCHGWLALDRRGQWRMRNEYAQQHGLPGDPVRHAALIAFIERNYEADAQGHWYFQNGPQRVYVELEYTPWIVRLHAASATQPARLRTTTDRAFTVQRCMLDAQGNVLFGGCLGATADDEANSTQDDVAGATVCALLHDQDMDLFAQSATLYNDSCGAIGEWRLDDQVLAIEPVSREDAARQFGFVASPAATLGALSGGR